MSPRQADPAVRTALIEAAASLIAIEGGAALTLRRVADEVGTSTMAVYTHFGGMAELRREVRREGFARLREHLEQVEDTGDTVADLMLLGWAYYRNATTNPSLYRVMFMEQPVADDEAGVGLDTFERLVDGVRRCLAAGRFKEGEAVGLATQLWAVSHGVVTLQLAGMLDADTALATYADCTRALFGAYGDHPGALGRSIVRVRERITGRVPARR